jgi:hypothetical protein
MGGAPGAMIEPGQPRRGPRGAGGPGAGEDQELRLQNIERRLEEVMRAMERMMREQERRQRGPEGSTGPRRESRAEEEDIKVRPGTRSRTPTAGDQPTPRGLVPR